MPEKKTRLPIALEAQLPSDDLRAPKPYSIEAAFQRSVAALAARSPRFWNRVGGELKHDRLSDPAASLCVRAVFLIAQTAGSGPSSGVAVLQRVHALVQDGKVTHEEMQTVADLLAEAADITEDDAVAGLAPVIQQDLRDQAVRAGIEAFGRKQDLERVIALEDRARKFGKADEGRSLKLGAEAVSAISSLKNVVSLPYGVWELDAMEDSGLPRGGLGVIIAGSGLGKSQLLCHVSASTVWTHQGAVAYATLELPSEMVQARVIANLTGVPVREVILDPTAIGARVGLISKAAPGSLYVRKFTPLVTRVSDITQWVEDLEQETGEKVGLLVVDYGDKVGAPKKNGEDQNGYGTGLIVYEGLRLYAERRDLFCWTASQATRRKEKGKRLDMDDVADSMHKVRVADVVLTLSRYGEEGSRELTAFLAKSRYGSDRQESSPILTDFAHGRFGQPTHGCNL